MRSFASPPPINKTIKPFLLKTNCHVVTTISKQQRQQQHKHQQQRQQQQHHQQQQQHQQQQHPKNASILNDAVYFKTVPNCLNLKYSCTFDAISVQINWIRCCLNGPKRICVCCGWYGGYLPGVAIIDIQFIQIWPFRREHFFREKVFENLLRNYRRTAFTTLTSTS